MFKTSVETSKPCSFKTSLVSLKALVRANSARKLVSSLSLASCSFLALSSSDNFLTVFLPDLYVSSSALVLASSSSKSCLSLVNLPKRF